MQALTRELFLAPFNFVATDPSPDIPFHQSHMWSAREQQGEEREEQVVVVTGRCLWNSWEGPVMESIYHGSLACCLGFPK